MNRQIATVDACGAGPMAGAMFHALQDGFAHWHCGFQLI